MVRRLILPLVLLPALGCALSEAPRPEESMHRQAALPASTLCESPRDCPVDFQAQILPLLMKKCSPCHFPGGSMYARLPFDQEAAIRRLGTKLFTRIEPEGERALLRLFLAQSDPDSPQPTNPIESSQQP